MAFEIPLAEQKIKPHQVTALHLMMGFALVATGAFIISVFFAMMLIPFSWEPVAKGSEINVHSILLPEYIMVVAGLAILFLSFFRNKWLLKPRNNKALRRVELGFCVTLTVYSGLTGAFVITAIFGILAAAIIYSFSAENAGGQQPAVTVDEKGIRLPAIAKRRNINWAETERVLLRHGTLTINCIDNRLYQWITTANNIDGQAFEAYCTAHIEAAKQDRKKYDW